MVAVMDRMSTTWEAWMGISFGCVQCHSHPYDPIRHEEYYDFMEFFNQSADADLAEDLPKLPVPLDPSRYEEANALLTQIHNAENSLHEQRQKIDAATRWSQPQGMTAEAKKPCSPSLKKTVSPSSAPIQTSLLVRNIFSPSAPGSAPSPRCVCSCCRSISPKPNTHPSGVVSSARFS